jgi:XTP/dITP diphosphohydrolase
MSRKIFFVTNNPYKVKEAQAILKKKDIEVEQQGYGYPELQSENLEEIACYGAEWAAQHLKVPVMVDDSGLFIQALAGFPGPYSAYVQRTLGNKKILKLMEGEEDRRAVFRCAIGFCEPEKKPVVFTGEVWGRIAYSIRGMKGFGYDPIFEFGGKTFGEMGDEEKNAISHRHKALMKFADWLG